MNTVLLILGGGILAVVLLLAGMIGFGAGQPPPPLVSISDPFKGVDFRDLPPIETTPARQGAPIAFRTYAAGGNPAGPGRVVIAIHGSSANSSSLHPLAKALRADGIAVYAPDMRGHGGTGQRGEIDSAGQLDDDLADFLAFVKGRHPGAPVVLLGLSSGGGFALHAAASAIGGQFERTVLLAPMLGVGAPTVSPAVNTWATLFVPRVIGLFLLDKIGIHNFEYLPVLAFALAPEHRSALTGTYSFRLMKAFGTTDYAADLRRAPRPITVLVGELDELFHAALFAPTVRAVRPDATVSVLPGLSHVGIAIDARAVPAIAAAVRGTP